MRNGKMLAFLLLVTGIVYANGLLSGFVWDDKPLIIERQAFFSQPRKALDLLVSSDSDFLNIKTPYYRPLNTFSYVFDHYLWGLHPFWYHLENLLLHALVVILFYLLIMEVFENERLAFFSALLFAVYPVNAEAVDAVFNRNVLFCSVFALSSLLFLARGNKILSLLAYFMALLSKEPAIVLPFFLFSYGLTTKGVNFKKEWKVLAGFVGVTVFYFVVRYLVLGSFLPGEGAGFPLSRLKLITAVYFEHFRLFVYPFKLNALYTEQNLFFSPLKAAAAIGGVVLLLCTFLVKKTPEPVRAGAQWIFWGLLPVSNIIKIPSAPVAERYQYTIVLGFVLILGYLAERLSREKAFFGMAAAAMLSIALGARTFERNFVWHDNISLFSSMTRSDPQNPLAHYDLGLAYDSRGGLEKAASEFRTALALKPSLADARVDLGIYYAKRGDLERAVQEFKTALVLSPESVKAMLNLGVAYAKEGRLDDAVREFRGSVNLDPSMPEAHMALGMGYEKEGLFREAAAEFENVLKLDPGNPLAVNNLNNMRRIIRN
ncbi:MAG: tetratricopeptide repeat protein [Nitrospiraceae bacterium]|nr:tetratricopeptide repeat protein [Nitrospiraceae bacterium]